MKKLIMTLGLPGSGKSTWAEQKKTELEAMGLKVLITNKDEIRKAMTAAGWTWSRDAEKDVIKAQDSIIKGAFAQGNDIVIVADTNFGFHKERLTGLARHCEAHFEIQNFTHIPLATCIERDGKRPNPVGAKAISSMYNKYLSAVDFQQYTPDPRKSRAIICDLDGTLALHNGKRSPFDYSKVGEDDLNEVVAEVVKLHARMGYVILYTSGREDSCRNATEMWLSKHNLPVDVPHMLIMRQTKDNRRDDLVKYELFNNYIRNNYNVRFVLDDRDRVVKMWREIGLSCWQVNYGNF